MCKCASSIATLPCNTCQSDEAGSSSSSRHSCSSTSLVMCKLNLSQIGDTIFSCSCGSTTTCIPCSAPRYSITAWKSGMSSSPSFFSTITLQTCMYSTPPVLAYVSSVSSHLHVFWLAEACKTLLLSSSSTMGPSVMTHHDGLLFQTSKCCCVLGAENDRHPEATEQYKAVLETRQHSTNSSENTSKGLHLRACCYRVSHTSDSFPCTTHAICSHKVQVSFWGPTPGPVQNVCKLHAGAQAYAFQHQSAKSAQYLPSYVVF